MRAAGGACGFAMVLAFVVAGCTNDFDALSSGDGPQPGAETGGDSTIGDASIDVGTDGSATETSADTNTDTGAPIDTGTLADTGPMDTGPTDTGPIDTGPADTAVADTAMTNAALTADARQKILARIPLGRLAHLSDIAHLAAFLASDNAGFITGATIPVDGGILTT